MWDTTAPLHVWPWPYKFAVILNMPAAFAGMFFSAMVFSDFASRYGRVATEAVGGIVSLLLTLPLWYWIGLRFDRTCGTKSSGYLSFWVFLSSMIILSFSGALYLGPIDYLLYGCGVWVLAAIAIAALTRARAICSSSER
jgi:hypothetical protein